MWYQLQRASQVPHYAFALSTITTEDLSEIYIPVNEQALVTVSDTRQTVTMCLGHDYRGLTTMSVNAMVSNGSFWISEEDLNQLEQDARKKHHDENFASIDIDMLKVIHRGFNGILTPPRHEVLIDHLSIPDDFKQAWKTYIDARHQIDAMIKKYEL